MKRPIFFAAVAGAISLFHSEAAVERELHVVGVYQGAGPVTGQNNQGTATIHVDRPEKGITLFLSCYDPIRWQITAGAGTVIERVFLNGYYDQAVDGLPEGTPVVETTYEGGGAYLSIGYSLDDPRTLGSIPLIEQQTGMTISSFHGTYEAPTEAIVIDAIQNDPRLSSSWPQPVPPDEVPSLSFELASIGSVGVEVRNYTLQGPSDGGALLPQDDIVVPDADDRFYYGGDGEPFRFDTMNGVIDTLPIPQSLPELSWPRGITFDTDRDRAVLVSLGGEGFLYAFSAGSRAWSLISSMDQRDADSVAYHPPDDSLYVVLYSYSTIHLPTVLRLSSIDGSELGRIRLPALPFEIGSGARSEIVSVGEFLVLLLSHQPYNSVSPPRDERIYLIDPRTGGVKLTWRRIGEPPPPTKVPAFPSQTGIAISQVPPPPNVDAARPWWSATVRLMFDHPLAEVTKWGEPIREGNSFAVDVEAVQPSGAVPLPPRTATFDRAFVLGGLPSGFYNFRVTSRGRTLREQSFTIPLEPPGGEVIADVSLSVDSRDPGRVTAKAHIEFRGYYVVTGQSPVSRDALGRFVLEATAEQGFITQVFPPPPFPVETLSYDLGEVPPGRHTAIFKMNGRTFATKDFVVGDPRPPVNAEVSAHFETIAEGTIAHVRIHLPNDFFIMSDPGRPVVDGRVVSIDATFERNPHPSPLAVTKVISHAYFLGPLESGDYRFVYRMNGEAKLEQPFSVERPPPPPPEHASLDFIAIKHGDSSTAAEVGLSVPDFKFVSDWGDVRVDGNRFKVSITLGNAPIPVPVGFDPVADPPRHIERHVYSLGVVDPGDYVLAVFEGTRFLGERAFQVGPKPPPPPPPLPLVAFIRHGVDATGAFVDVGLAFLRPRLMVKHWGVPTREGNRFKVNIEIGEAVLPPVPLEPPADGTLVFITNSDNPGPGLVPESDRARFGEIGGWPGFIVRHRYPLGVLANGEYVFVVCLGGDEAARHVFRVGEPGTPGPLISVQADDIVELKSEPQPFTVHYHPMFGIARDVMSRKVIVTGPHGFSAVAKQLACHTPLDGIGVISCLYEVEGPGGDWDAADNGRYTVCVEPALVITGNDDRPLPGVCAFGWRVDIEPAPPPHLPATVAVSMRDGRWFADVRFDNTGGWFAADWGEVRLFGPVFSAFAKLHDLPEGSLAPIPASFEHTYSLGELRPGRYRFVFRSDRGHSGNASINVPGVEPPTPLVQWKLNVLGPGAGPDDADSDGDGLPLFGEYYLGCDPTRHDAPEIRPSLIRGAEGRWHAALGFRHINDGDASLRCVIQASDDMINWRDCGEEIDLIAGEPAIDGSRENSVRHRLPLQRGGRTFLRLRLLQGAD